MLEALENDAEPAASADAERPAVPLRNASAPLDLDPERGAVGDWEMRYEWIEDPDASEFPPPLPSASEDAIASELHLDRARESSDLHKLRREFMWRNHPDRRPEIPSDLANARVAVANMLIDRALKKTRRRTIPPSRSH
jgi:hypothetical protein